jgi:biotin carboxyl carrier protein
LTAIRHVILAAAIAAPGSITEIVSAAATAAPTVSGVIVQAAQEALPAQADAIAKAAPPIVPTKPSSDGTVAQTPPELEMKQELDSLKSSGKLNDPKEVSAATKRVIEKNTRHYDIPAALGARVIAIHKHSGDVVHAGDKILTLRMPDGKVIPILAKQDGVVQELTISKGGIIGNSRPASAKADPFKSLSPTAGDHEEMILITMVTLPLEK